MFSKIFSLTVFAQLRFVPHLELEMKACSVVYQLQLYVFWGHYP